MASWLGTVGALSPLLRHADADGHGGEAGALRRLFTALPAGCGFLLTVGRRADPGGAFAALATERGWRHLHLGPAQPVDDRDAAAAVLPLPEPPQSPALASLLAAHGVPPRPDGLAIGIGVADHGWWQALPASCTPAVVVVGFEARIPLGVAAVREPCEAAGDEAGAVGADVSFAAWCSLATAKGYRLVHVHGPRRLFFLRQDLTLPVELCAKPAMTDAEFALLTDGSAFEAAFGSAPDDIDPPPAPDVSRAPWVILAPAAPRKSITVAGIPLQVLADKHDAQWYLQRKTHEERHSLLYPLLREAGFDRFVDIGANVGYVSVIAALEIPAVRVLAVEADPRLAALVRDNFSTNLGRTCGMAEVVNAIVGDHDARSASFSLNPGSTLDNRVSMPKWEQVHVPMWTMDALLARSGMAPAQLGAGRTFFKIDTQGFELRVLRGLEMTLASRSDWLLKMEFAPDWLRSQGSDPETVLDHLQLRYEFAEFPERIPYGTPDLDALFATPVRLPAHRRFIEHVCSLNANGLGWVDLIVRPRPT